MNLKKLALAMLAVFTAKVEAGCDVWTSSSSTLFFNITSSSQEKFYPLKNVSFTSNNTYHSIPSIQFRMGGCINNITCPEHFFPTTPPAPILYFCEAYYMTAEKFTSIMQHYLVSTPLDGCAEGNYFLNAVAELNNDNACASYIKMPNATTPQPSLFTIFQYSMENESGANAPAPAP